jgi:hypothetical protein
MNVLLPGTDVPGYRLFRPRSTSSGQALRDSFVRWVAQVSLLSKRLAGGK